MMASGIGLPSPSKNPALYTDVFAVGGWFHQRGLDRVLKRVAVLFGRQAVRKKGSDRLRRRLLEAHGSALHWRGVSSPEDEIELVAEGELRLGDVD